MDKYLLNLSGIQESSLKLVSKEVWDWIFSPYPNNSLSNKEMPPANTHPEFIQYNHCVEEVYISQSSYENDRALQAPGKHFSSFKLLHDYVNKNNITLVSEYEGCIY